MRRALLVLGSIAASCHSRHAEVVALDRCDTFGASADRTSFACIEDHDLVLIDADGDATRIALAALACPAPSTVDDVVFLPDGQILTHGVRPNGDLDLWGHSGVHASACLIDLATKTAMPAHDTFPKLRALTDEDRSPLRLRAEADGRLYATRGHGVEIVRGADHVDLPIDGQCDMGAVDGALILGCLRDNTLTILRGDNGWPPDVRVTTSATTPGPTERVTLSSDCTELAAWGADQLIVIDTATGEITFTWNTPDVRILDVTPRGDGWLVAERERKGAERSRVRELDRRGRTVGVGRVPARGDPVALYAIAGRREVYWVNAVETVRLRVPWLRP
jgi:hypothetical protein